MKEEDKEEEEKRKGNLANECSQTSAVSSEK